MAVRITYLVRCSDDAFMEVSPREIAEWIAMGMKPEIRIVAEV